MKIPSRPARFALLALLVITSLTTWAIYSTHPVRAPAATPTAAARPANCVPLPWTDRGATPLPGSRQLLETPGLIETLPTVAPHNVAHTYDLYPKLPPGGKLRVYVFRCDGTEDVYLVDPKAYQVGVPFQLGPGDIISGVSSPAEMYAHGPASSVTSPYRTAAPTATR